MFWHAACCGHEEGSWELLMDCCMITLSWCLHWLQYKLSFKFNKKKFPSSFVIKWVAQEFYMQPLGARHVISVIFSGAGHVISCDIAGVGHMIPCDIVMWPSHAVAWQESENAYLCPATVRSPNKAGVLVLCTSNVLFSALQWNL